MTQRNPSEIWENIFKSKAWGKYPSLALVRFVASNFYNSGNRNDVRILELGCGPGGNLWFLAREGFQISGIDFSESACQQLLHRLSSEGLSNRIDTILVGDYSEKINEFPDSCFDAVVDVESLYCNSFEVTKNIIKAAISKLKPGGFLFSQTFSEQSWGFAIPESDYHAGFPVEGPMANTGLCRYTSKDDIASLYVTDTTRIVSIEKQELQLQNGKIISEWIIIAKKMI